MRECFQENSNQYSITLSAGTASALHPCSWCARWAGNVRWRLHLHGREGTGDQYRWLVPRHIVDDRLHRNVSWSLHWTNSWDRNLDDAQVFVCLLYTLARPSSKRWIQEPLVVRDRDGRPQEDPLAVHCFYVCSGSALLGDLVGVSRSMERDLLSVLLIYPRIFLRVFIAQRQHSDNNGAWPWHLHWRWP